MVGGGNHLPLSGHHERFADTAQHGPLCATTAAKKEGGCHSLGDRTASGRCIDSGRRYFFSGRMPIPTAWVCTALIWSPLAISANWAGLCTLSTRV